MSRGAIVLVLVVAAMGAGGWLLATKYLRLGAVPESSASGEEAARRALAPTVSARLARLDARLRLPPDRRAIAAVAEIQKLVRGGEPKQAEVAYASGSWRVTHEGEMVGVLSGFPRFSALLALLDPWAAKQREQRGALKLGKETKIRPELQKQLDRFDDGAAFEVLAAVDAKWRSRRASAGDLLAATEALAQLCAILPNDFPATDGLASRAFASLALARQLAPERTQRAEITLAFATGYWTHAREIAEGLPWDEPLAAFVRGDLQSLERVAVSGDSRDADFFHGARLARSRPGAEWVAWFGTLERKLARRTAVVGTGLALGDAASGDFVPELYAAVLLDPLRVPDDERPEAVLTQCEALHARIEKKGRAFAGPFADAALYAGAYRAACLSALYRKLVYFVETVDRPDAALALARSLPQDARPDLEALRGWTELVARSEARARDPEAFAKAIAEPALAMEQRWALVRRAVAPFGADDPQRSDVADAASTWLDSRASGRLFAGELARDVYRDPDLEEKLFAAAVDLDGVERAALVSQVAGFRRDWQPLWAMAGSSAYRVDERMAALAALERQTPLEAVRLRIGYERLLVGNSENEALRRQFARFLEHGLADRRAARNVLFPILAGHKDADLESTHLAGAIALLHLEDGNARAAWALVENRLAGNVVPSAATRAQIALGNLTRAEEIARAALARDPNSLPAAVELASVLWESGRNAEAAELVAKAPRVVPDNERCWHLCRAFTRTFHGKPIAEVEVAFRELIDEQVDYALLRGTVDSYRTSAAAETAFALGILIHYPDAAIEIHTDSYKTLKQVRGEAEALAWVSTKIPGEQLAAAAETFYLRGADELLWKLIDHPHPQGGSATWLLRAAAYVRAKHPTPTQRSALLEYFRAHQETPEERLGAALLGLIDAHALLERSRTETELSRAAYLLGSRAEGAGDFHAAMRLYQLALTSKQRTLGRDLAHEAVTRINALDTSLDALEADRAPTRKLTAGR
ncbi:MAG: tetratricopeptide repeat protein [Myxococcota bacterium]